MTEVQKLFSVQCIHWPSLSSPFIAKSLLTKAFTFCPLLCQCGPVCCWSCTCASLAMPCRTTLTELCGQRGRTSAFLYLARAERVKRRPQRRSSFITLWRARPTTVWLHSWIAYCSPTLSWRFVQCCLITFKIRSFSLSYFSLSSF